MFGLSGITYKSFKSEPNQGRVPLRPWSTGSNWGSFLEDSGEKKAAFRAFMGKERGIIERQGILGGMKVREPEKKRREIRIRFRRLFFEWEKIP